MLGGFYCEDEIGGRWRGKKWLERMWAFFLFGIFIDQPLERFFVLLEASMETSTCHQKSGECGSRLSMAVSLCCWIDAVISPNVVFVSRSEFVVATPF